MKLKVNVLQGTKSKRASRHKKKTFNMCMRNSTDKRYVVFYNTIELCFEKKKKNPTYCLPNRLRLEVSCNTWFSGSLSRKSYVCIINDPDIGSTFNISTVLA